MLWKPAVVIVVLFLCGCIPRHAVVTPELRTQMMADLKAGKPNLTCEVECVFSWMNDFQRMITLHNASQWEALAELVMQVGHGKDISYYFLGKAAEGLGYYDAAVKYYQISLQLFSSPDKLKHCRDVPAGDYCGGLNLGTVLPKLIASAQAPEKALNQTRSQSGTQPRVAASIGNRSGRGFDFSSRKTVNESGRDLFELDVRYGGKVVYEEQSILVDPAARLLQNTPTAGCQTTVAETYTGGAHCCFAAVMAVTCGPANYLYSIFFGNGGGGDGITDDVDGDGAKELALSDQRFVYYNADARHSLPYSGSMSMTRYAVWTPQGWRVTAPGELQKAYLKHKNDALNEKVPDEHKVARAIAVTYYALMSGEDANKARKLLESLLPQDWKAISNKVFSDIQTSVSHGPMEPGTKTSVLTTIMKTSALNKRGGPSVIAFS